MHPHYSFQHEEWVELLELFPSFLSGDIEVRLPGGPVQGGCGAVALGYGPRTGVQETGDQHQF